MKDKLGVGKEIVKMGQIVGATLILPIRPCKQKIDHGLHCNKLFSQYILVFEIILK
jgi:hypothetical protein